MKSTNKTKEELLDELAALRKRIGELEKQEIHSRRAPENFGEKPERCFPQKADLLEAIYVVFDRKFEFANDRFAELFGVSPEEVCSSKFDPMTLIAPESRPFIQEEYRKGCRGAFTTKQINYTGLSKDGLKIECDTFLMFIPYKWGVAIQGMLRGISKSLRQVDEALTTRHSDLPFGLNAAPRGVLYAASGHQVMQINETFGKSKGLPAGQILRVDNSVQPAIGMEL